MKNLEDRLRRDLPELADALGATAPEGWAEHRDAGRTVDTVVISRGPSPDRRRFLFGAAAATATLALGAGVLRRLGERTVSVGSGPAPPTFGAWRSMAEGPLQRRAHPVHAWTGTAAVFWAGSSLDRSQVYTDGALYDPAADAWSDLTVPGWGHPGLTAAYFDGELIALAKGGGTRFDVEAGVWRELPRVDGMFLGATVATDDALYGLGPVSVDREGQPDLAIAEYDKRSDSWVYRPALAGSEEQAPLTTYSFGHVGDVFSDGRDVYICGERVGCAVFDPVSERWRSVGPPTQDGARSRAVPTDEGVLLVTEDLASDTDGMARAFVLAGSEWVQVGAGLPVADFDSLSLAAAGEWVVALSSRQPPLVIHVRSGAWQLADDSPLHGVQAPAAVWTGDVLIVWGGVTDDPGDPGGAVWTPPPTG